MNSRFTQNPFLRSPNSTKSDPKPPRSHKKMWECEVCARTMSALSMESHLAGKPHRLLEQQQQQQGRSVQSGSSFRGNLIVTQTKSATVSESTIGEGRSGKQRQSERTRLTRPEPSGNGTWTCELCLRSVTINAKDIHLTGARHRAVVQQREVELRSREQPQNTTTAGATTTARSTEGENSELNDAPQQIQPQTVQQPHAVLTLRIIPSTTRAPKVKKQIPNSEPQMTLLLPGEWHCEACSRTMPLGSRYHHCQGREHRAKYRAMKITEGTPAPRRGGAAKNAMRVGGVSFCECGKKFSGGGYCKDCDFSVDV